MTTDMSCRILYLIGQLHAGGSERQLYYLLRNLDRDRYMPAVAVWNFCEKDAYVPAIRNLDVPIYSLVDRSSVAAKLGFLYSLVRRLKPEVLHSYSAYLNFAVHWSTRYTRTIGIGSTRSDFVLDWEGSSRWLACLNTRWPRNQIYNSFQAAKAASAAKRMFMPGHIYVVRNGVDLERFRPSPIPDSGVTNIVGIGSLIPIKRWDKLLAVASELKQRSVEFSIQIAGDGSLRESLQHQIANRILEDRVQLLGHVTDVHHFLSGATFLVHCSDAEGCPNAVIEAMASGRAVVATDVGDIPRLVDDGRTGFVVRRGDDEMLVRRIAELIGNRDLSRRMGQAGRTKAEKNFGLDRLVAGTLAAYCAAGWKDSKPVDNRLSGVSN
jgi:glycosyltransferase involved in cell wall biosynthesis